MKEGATADSAATKPEEVKKSKIERMPAKVF